MFVRCMLSVLLVALVGAAILPSNVSGHQLECCLMDVIAMADDPPVSEVAAIEGIGGLIEQLVLGFNSTDNEQPRPPSKEEVKALVIAVIVKYPSLLPFVYVLKCLIRTITLEVLQYAPKLPRANYKDNEVCLNKSQCSGIEEIKFVHKDPKDNKFLYLAPGSGLPYQFLACFGSMPAWTPPTEMSTEGNALNYFHSLDEEDADAKFCQCVYTLDPDDESSSFSKGSKGGSDSGGRKYRII